MRNIKGSLPLLSISDSGKRWPYNNHPPAPTSANRPGCGHIMAMAARDHEVSLPKLPSITVCHIC